MVLEVLVRALFQDKQTKHSNNKGKSKFLVDVAILYIENPKDPTENLLKLISAMKLQDTK